MRKSILKNYLITFGAALVIMAIVVAVEVSEDGFTGRLLRLSSDACFVSGALLLIAAALMLVANGGGFHPFGYLRKRMHYTITKNPDDLMSYTDYVLSRKQKGKLNLTQLLVVGGVLVLISLLLALL